jgi:hypothetical protein
MTKLRRIFATGITVLLLIALVGCGGGTDSTDNTKSADKATPSDSGEIGDLAFAIKDAQLVKDWEGNDSVLVTFDFTNNGDEATSFLVSGFAKAFQDGVELEGSFLSSDDKLYNDNEDKNIKTGVSIEVYKVFLLSNSTSPVEVEVAEAFSFSDKKFEKTFEIAD